MSSGNKCENMDNQRGQNESLAADPVSDPKPSPTPSANVAPGVAVKTKESNSLNCLLVYDSDSNSSSTSEIQVFGSNWRDKEATSSSSSSDSEEDSEEESSNSSSSSDDDSDEGPVEPPPESKGAIKKDRVRPKADGEFSIDELPPVPDLSSLEINLENECFTHMGNVLGIVDRLVTIAAIPNSPAYDLDTLLFLDNGKRPLGFVFDVLGQVTSPIYAVRFNSAEDIKKLGVEVGTKIYSAPNSKHTQYVFLQQLLKMKGSDASWLGDSEVPSEFADYSDDEAEYYQRSGTKKTITHMKRTHSSDNHKKFENTMNKRNILNTKFNKYMDSYKQARLNKLRSGRQGAPGPQISTSLPVFDPSVPPPNVRPYCTSFAPSPGSGVHYLPPPEYFGVQWTAENNNGGQSPGFMPSYFMNNFIANLNQTNSANYFTNHAGNNHPGPSHE